MATSTTARAGGDERDAPGLAWGHPARVFDLAFSPRSSDVVASASEDGTARVWRRCADDPYLWKQTFCCYGGHSSEVLRVAWHPSGRLLATGGAEGAVRLWRADGGGGGDADDADSPPSSSAAVTYAAPIDPLASEHPEEIYTMIFASRGGGGGGAGAAAAAGGGGEGDGEGSNANGSGAGTDVSGGELLLTASAEALYLWDLETGKLLQGAPVPEARLLGSRLERVPMPPWRGPRTGRDGGGGNDDDNKKGKADDNNADDDDDDDDAPPPGYPTEMPTFVFGAAQVGGGAPPTPSLLAAGCCDGTLRLWAFHASSARLQPLFGTQAHAPGDMASFVHVLTPQAEETPAGGGAGAVGAGGPYIVSVARGGHASVFDARRLVAAGATAGTMTPRDAFMAGVVQRHWLAGPTMGGAVVPAGAGGGGGDGKARPTMLAAVGADGRVRLYEARALLQPPPPPGLGGGEEEDREDEQEEEQEDDEDGPPSLRPARVLRVPAPALRAPLLAAAASADGAMLAASGFAVEAGSLSREEHRLRQAREEAGGGRVTTSSSVRRGGVAGTALAGRRRRGARPAAVVGLVGGGSGGGGGGGDDDDGSGLFAALTIGGGGGGGGKQAQEEKGGGEEEEEGAQEGQPQAPPKCEGESVSARAAVFVWRL